MEDAVQLVGEALDLALEAQDALPNHVVVGVWRRRWNSLDQLVIEALDLALEVHDALPDHVVVGAWRRRWNYLERARVTARCRSGPSSSFVVAALPLV